MSINVFKNEQFRRNAKKFNSYYINRFISMKCAVDMLQHDLFPNAKEITESFGAFEATKHLSEEFDWKKECIVVCVGDGHKPRTAATFAYRTKWECYSVDPELRIKPSYLLKKKRTSPIGRLHCHRNKIEDIKFEFDKPTLICCVHSHAKLTDCVRNIKAPLVAIIDIPCCFPSDIKNPDLEYRDEQIWSEKNLIKVWNSYKGN